MQAKVLRLADYLVLPSKDVIKTPFELFLKIDEKREFFQQNMEKHINGNNSNIIPREVRNLTFNVNFKDGEPRSRGEKNNFK